MSLKLYFPATAAILVEEVKVNLSACVLVWLQWLMDAF